MGLNYNHIYLYKKEKGDTGRRLGDVKTRGYPIVPAPFVEETYSFPIE